MRQAIVQRLIVSLATVWSLAAFAAQPPAPVPVTVRRAAEMITADKLQRHVTFLASPELNGRSTPSAGLDKAAGHLVQYLSEWRVRPLVRHWATSAQFVS